jgi:aminoglycoside 3-N-acetyltransferase
MAIFGDRARAAAFAKGEIDVVQPTAANSCYGKLYDEDGFVLLAGVSHASNTYLHAVAEILSLPDRRAKQKTPVTVRKKSGETVERAIWLFDEKYGDISHRFPQYETAFRYHRCITDGFLGDAPTQLCSARGMLAVVKGIFAAAKGADPLADENPIAPILYCKT